MATLPLPAPTSHSTPLGGSASLPSATARTSPLVTMPSRCSNAEGGRPHARVAAGAGGPVARMTTDNGSHVPPARPSRLVRATTSPSRPSRLHTATVVGSAIRASRSLPTDSGG
jgi:hypothetical protein